MGERPFRSAHALSGDVFCLIFPCVFSHPPASLGRVVSCTMLRVNAMSCAVGHCSQLAPRMVKGSGLRKRAVFKLKGEKKKRAIHFRYGREKHLESFSLNKALLWHLDAFIQVKKEFGTFPPHSAGLEEKKQIKRQDYLICCFVLFTWSVVPVDVGWVLLQPTKGLDSRVIFSQDQGFLSNEER